MARLPVSEHTDRPWRVHALAPDFRVEDVWSVRLPDAAAEDFHAALRALQTGAGPENFNALSRALFAIRWRLGALLGWDDADAQSAHRSLRDRLPADLRAVPDWARAPGSTPLSMVYLTSDECVEELINATVHSLMHLGWVRTPSGEFELRMTVLVKPIGRLSNLYMAAIAPFRHGLVYPSLTRTWERAWLEHGPRPIDPRTPVSAYVGASELPADLRDVHDGPADYVDAFRLPVTDRASAEEWARAMLGDEPEPAAYVVGTLLGERVTGGRSPDRIGGSTITARGPDWVRLESPSWLLSGATVVHATDDLLTLAVFQRYDKAFGLGRAVWGALSPIHRRLAAPTLRRARRELRRRTPATVA